MQSYSRGLAFTIVAAALNKFLTTANFGFRSCSRESEIYFLGVKAWAQ